MVLWSQRLRERWAVPQGAMVRWGVSRRWGCGESCDVGRDGCGADARGAKERGEYEPRREETVDRLAGVEDKLYHWEWYRH